MSFVSLRSLDSMILYFILLSKCGLTRDNNSTANLLILRQSNSAVTVQSVQSVMLSVYLFGGLPFCEMSLGLCDSTASWCWFHSTVGRNTWKVPSLERS